MILLPSVGGQFGSYLAVAGDLGLWQRSTKEHSRKVLSLRGDTAKNQKRRNGPGKDCFDSELR